MNTRKQELLKIFENIDSGQKIVISNLIDDVVFMENQMSELRKLPFIRVHPSDATRQESTKAAKQYKDLSQAYMNAIKILCSLLSKESGEEETPLRKYFKGLE